MKIHRGGALDLISQWQRLIERAAAAMRRIYDASAVVDVMTEIWAQWDMLSEDEDQDPVKVSGCRYAIIDAAVTPAVQALEAGEDPDWTRLAVQVRRQIQPILHPFREQATASTPSLAGAVEAALMRLSSVLRAAR